MLPDFFHALAEGARAAVWLGLLWLASGAGRADGAPRSSADRVRDVLLVGTAIPFALGLLGLLAAPTCLLALLGVLAVRRLRAPGARPPGARPPGARPPSRAAPPHAAMGRTSRLGAGGGSLAAHVPALVTLGVAWPALVRPPDSGDTLWYHLPNAATWAHDGGIWQTTTHYWWYPGGSELFAAGLIAVAGPLAAGLAGTVALLLLGLRIGAWCSAAGMPEWVGGALAAACVATAPLAAQGANLGNDVWLAALVLETLWCARIGAPLAGSAALCALVKPYGIVFAVTALVARRARPRTWLLALAPFGLWIARDAVLWRGALLPPSETAFADPFGTTIAGNLARVPSALAAGVAHAGIGAFVFLVLGVATLIASREFAVRGGALVALLVFVFEPFGFRNDLPQLATGESLRFAAPFFALGAVGAASFGRRFAAPLGLVGALVAAVELSRVLAQFWFVPAARLVLPILALGAALRLIAAPRARALVVGFGAPALGAVAVAFAAAEPAAFYDAWGSRDGTPTRIFSRLASQAPAALVVSNVHAGPFAVVLPSARVADARKRDPCGEARALGALLVAHEPRAADADDPAACGTVVERDGAFAVVRPTTP